MKLLHYLEGHIREGIKMTDSNNMYGVNLKEYALWTF
jgi:hypothetical protein